MIGTTDITAAAVWPEVAPQLVCRTRLTLAGEMVPLGKPLPMTQIRLVPAMPLLGVVATFRLTAARAEDEPNTAQAARAIGSAALRIVAKLRQRLANNSASPMPSSSQVPGSGATPGGPLLGEP